MKVVNLKVVQILSQAAAQQRLVRPDKLSSASLWESCRGKGQAATQEATGAAG